MVFLWEIPVFLQLSQVGLFGIKWAFLTLKTVNCRNYSSQTPIQLSKGNIGLDARASTMHTFLLEVHGLPLLSWIALMEEMQPIIPCKHLRFLKNSFQKRTQFSHENMCFWHGCFSFDRYMCFFNLADYGYLKWGEPPTLNIDICRVHCFQRLNEFS
jgi:hypothetical protein